MSYRTLKLELQSFVPELNAVQAGIRLNRSYQHILALHPWSFLRTEALVKLLAPYKTGTVTTTYNSATVSGASTVWTAAMIGRFFRSSTNTPFYRISDVDAVAQTLTLESVYGETGAAGAAYTIFKTQYAKPTDCNIIRGIRFDYNLPETTKTYIDTMEPDRSSTGQPCYWFNLDNASFEVWPAPDQNYTLRLYYYKTVSDLSAETDTTLMNERIVLAHARMSAYLQLASDAERGQYYLQLATAAKAEFDDLWLTVMEDDMRKLSLPTRVLDESSGEGFPVSNDWAMRHDTGDPRGPWRW